MPTNYAEPSRRPLGDATHLFFDMDDTLYPPASGVWRAIGGRINRFMIERVGFPEEDIDSRRQEYFHKYGTTLNGLRKEFAIDPLEYLKFVHAVPVEELLRPDPRLQAMLKGMPQRKFIFSNADRPYIQRVLDSLGIAGFFEGIIDIVRTGFVCKPLPGAYAVALDAAGSPPAERCVVVDDLVRNLEPASKLGMITVLVNHTLPDGAVHYQIDDIYQLTGLWNASSAGLS
jgi:putative hydrolase of the HAD superfamily